MAASMKMTTMVMRTMTATEMGPTLSSKKPTCAQPGGGDNDGVERARVMVTTGFTGRPGKP